MRLYTAHRILISTFVLFSTGFGIFELVLWRGGSGNMQLAMGIGSLVVAAGFLVYLVNLVDEYPE